MPRTIELPVLSRQELLDANAEAIKNNYSAFCFQTELQAALHEGNTHPVTGMMLDENGNLVCRILAGLGETIFVALTQSRYNNLTTVPIDLDVIMAMSQGQSVTKH